MKNLVEQLSQYADYHRDARNITTHFWGVPMILFAVVILLSRPVWSWPDSTLVLSPAVLAALLAVCYYVLLDLRYGLVMSVVLAAMLSAAGILAQQSTTIWLGTGLGLFVVGWIIQFVGHFWEGRKPAFFDDLVGLVIGPLFVLAEMGFALGLRQSLQAEIHRRCGPVRRGHSVAPQSQK